MISADLVLPGDNTTVIIENVILKNKITPISELQQIIKYPGIHNAEEKRPTTDNTPSFLNKPSGDNYTRRGDNMISDSHLMNDSNLQSSATKRMDVLAGGTRNSHPFGHEYKSPIPMPFQNNPEDFPRMKKDQSVQIKNLEQIVRLISQKMFEDGVMNLNKKRRVKFSGVYYNPHKLNDETQTAGHQDSGDKDIGVVELDPLDRVSSVNGHAYNTDPLFQYKPVELGDINLLAEHEFRFSPSLAQNRVRKKAYHRTRCPPESYQRIVKPKSNNSGLFLQSSTDKGRHGSEAAFYNSHFSYGKPKQPKKKRPFSVQLDVYPVSNQDEEAMEYPEHLKEVNYITTSTQASVQRKPIFYSKNNPYNMYSNPNYQHYNHYPDYHRPTAQPNTVQVPQGIYLPQNNQQMNSYNDHRKQLPTVNSNTPLQMLIYLNLYPKKKVIDHQTDEEMYKRMDTGIILDDLNINNSPVFNITDKSFEENRNFKQLKKNLSETFDTNVNLNHSKNITIDEIKQGYGFMVPGPKNKINIPIHVVRNNNSSTY